MKYPSINHLLKKKKKLSLDYWGQIDGISSIVGSTIDSAYSVVRAELCTAKMKEILQGRSDFFQK